jgi:F-type H+-transporting ATPase subunit delta
LIFLRAGIPARRTKTMSAQEEISYYWAKALYAAAKKHNEVDQVDLDLHLVNSVACADRAVGLFFNHPLIPAGDKAKAVESAVKSHSAKGLLDIMFQRHHFNLLGSVAHRYRMMVRASCGEKDVEIRVPAPLSQEALKRLQGTICKAVGGNCNLVVTLDESIIGGVWMKVGTTVYDGTFRKDLELLKERLLA